VPADRARRASVSRSCRPDSSPISWVRDAFSPRGFPFACAFRPAASALIFSTSATPRPTLAPVASLRPGAIIRPSEARGRQAQRWGASRTCTPAGVFLDKRTLARAYRPTPGIVIPAMRHYSAFLRMFSQFAQQAKTSKKRGISRVFRGFLARSLNYPTYPEDYSRHEVKRENQPLARIRRKRHFEGG